MNKKLNWLYMAIGYIIFSIFLVYANPFANAGSDPFGEMVVAQSIAEKHTVTLSGKYEEFFKLKNGDMRYQVFDGKNGLEYYFPIGTPFILSPLVKIANFFGYDALVGYNDSRGQRFVDVFLIFTLLIVTYKIVKHYLNNNIAAIFMPALLITGTVIGPVIATGLWSINFEILLIATSFLVAAKNSSKELIYGLLLGLLLFLGFMVRPTFAIFIFGIFALLFLEKKYLILIISMIFSAMLLIAFSAWSQFHYGEFLPPYYLASRLSTGNAVEAFFGLIFSPSRSVFVFSPIMILFAIFAFKKLTNTSLSRNNSHILNIYLLMVIAAFLSNVFFPHWTGGWSYGPRILADMTFVAFLFLLIYCKLTYCTTHQQCLTGNIYRFLFIGVPIGLSGIFNIYASQWNAFPNIDSTPSVVWDWRFPQPLMTKNLLIDKCLTQTKELGINENQCPK